jgi:MoxR-like ATPase
MAEQHDDFHRFTGTSGYIASGPLVDAVNCAVALERPLLIKGEPGTGKTLLAHHVSEGLGMPMLSWHIKSTSKAADGL